MKKVRGFEHIKGSFATTPQRSTSGSAGYDLRAYKTVDIPPMKVAYIPTGLKVYMPKDEYFKIVPRSSLFKKYHCIMPGSEGVIDHDYYNNQENEGHFKIVLLNLSNTETVTVRLGDRIAQGIFCKYLTTDNDKPILDLRTGGFGSTDGKEDIA